MLHADKQSLETDLKVSLLAIRERELNLYTKCFRRLGTIAGVFAGFAYQGACLASYFFPPDSSTAMRSAYLVTTTIAMDLNVAALFAATVCAALGPGLALRGPDGSMERAVEGLALEYRLTFLTFTLGVLAFYVSASIFVIIMMNWLMMVLLLLIILFFVHYTLRACKRIYRKFRLPANLAVGGNFNVDGTVGVSVTAKMSRNAERLEEMRQNTSLAARVVQWPCRQWLGLLLFFDDFIGVSAEIYEERYRSVSGQHGRWYNSSIASILRHLELPSHLNPARKAAVAAPGGGGGCVGVGVGVGGCRNSHTGRRYVRKALRGEGARSMLGSHTSVLETEAMQPIEHHSSGAISPPEEPEGSYLSR
jgi:hypothetical protein